MIAVQRGARKPLGALGLLPINPRRKKRLTIRLRNRGWNRPDGTDVRKKTTAGQLLQSIEFPKRIRAICDAGVFMNVFIGRKKPQLPRLDRPSERAHQILPGKWLLWIRCGIIQLIARVQRIPALVVRPASMPIVRPTARPNHDAAALSR